MNICSRCGKIKDSPFQQRNIPPNTYNFPFPFQNNNNFSPFNCTDNSNNINNSMVSNNINIINNDFVNNINNNVNNIPNNISNINNSNVYYNNYIFSSNNQNEHNIFSKFAKNKKGKKAQKKLMEKYKDKRPYDWICNRCNNLNYSFRTICNICKLPLKDNPFYISKI